MATESNCIVFAAVNGHATQEAGLAWRLRGSADARPLPRVLLPPGSRGERHGREGPCPYFSATFRSVRHSSQER